MSTTPNHNASGVGGIPADTPGSTFSPSPSVTFKAVIQDVASWWCYAILKKGDLKLFDELDDILDSLPGPFPASSSLSIRLRCLVPWHELLKQLYTPGCTVGEKQFETIQDKLLLLHQGFFSKTSAAEEFNDVLRMVQTHSVLSKLYSYFSKSDDTQNEQDATNKVLDQCNAEWESIYLESNGVPPSLLDLVDKNNGWDFEDRKDHIIQIVSFPESALTYRRLKKKMQSLLLHWFEHEIVDSNEAGTKVPELLQKRYRGIGYGGDDIVPNDTTESTKNVPKTPADSKVDANRLGEEKSNVVASPSAQQQQPQQQQDKKDEKKAGLILDSSDSDDWSDFDPEEELRRLKMHRERQKKLRSSNEREVEEMPVGEPSYSLPQRKSFRGRNRGRRNDRDYRHRSTNFPSCSQPSSGRKRARERRRRKLKARDPPRIRVPKSATQQFWDSDDSSSSSSSFFDETDETDEPDAPWNSSYFYETDDEVAPWTQEQDNALKNGIQCNGYGNWTEILKEEKQLLGSKDGEDLRERANILLGQR